MVRLIRLQDIEEEVLRHHPEADTSLIRKAYIFSAKAHEGQTRLSGEPYLSHPLEVAYLLAQMGMGPVTVSCGLLHDTVEDTATTLDELEEYFGEEVTDIVNGVTKIGQLSFGDRLTQQPTSKSISPGKPWTSMPPWPGVWACSASRRNWRIWPFSTWSPRLIRKSRKGWP